MNEGTIPAPGPTAQVRAEALAAPDSGIVEVFDYGRNRQGLIPLWVGEGDLPTPDFICDAAARSLAAGETFYTYQAGIPVLREAIARYIGRIYPEAAAADPPRAERFFVTIGGMHALQIAARLVAGEGDEVIVPTPAWPNFGGALTVAGATTVELPLRFADGGGADDARWCLDLDRLADAVGPRTRAIVVNSPANPTGWIATHDELAAVLSLARRHSLWIIADEIYGRIVFDNDRAPSFRDVMQRDDRILFVQTFSKNWSMTGCRIGWLEAPPELGRVIENLVQYSTSGVPVFMQRAALAALDGGEPFFARQLARIRASRDIVCAGLAASGRVRFARPQGAFYLFCRVSGEPDTRRLALRLVDEAGVGLAPGSAFGRGGEGFLRICFARNPDDMREATRRLTAWLGR
jgi:aspartate/methionine/tyrosine aminotransferase